MLNHLIAHKKSQECRYFCHVNLMMPLIIISQVNGKCKRRKRKYLQKKKIWMHEWESHMSIDPRSEFVNWQIVAIIRKSINFQSLEWVCFIYFSYVEKMIIWEANVTCEWVKYTVDLIKMKKSFLVLWECVNIK